MSRVVGARAAGRLAAGTMTVKVRDEATEAQLWGTSWRGTAVIRTVTIPAACPRCGEPRGEPRGHNFRVDGDWHHVHVWDNRCGHVDMYADVVREAAAHASTARASVGTYDQRSPR